MFMGDPRFEEVSGVADLLYAVNTNWDILLEVGTSNYFLLNGRSWLMTKDLVNGPWQAATSLPQSFLKLPADKNWEMVKKYVPGILSEVVPKVLVSYKPAEMILTEGRPNYSPIAGIRRLS